MTLLETLFGINDVEQFVLHELGARHRQREAPRACEWVRSALGGELNLRSFLQDATVVRLWYPTKDGQRTLLVQPKDALQLHDDLPVSLLIEESPFLSQIGATIADELGFTKRSVVASVFANKKHVTTKTHFDRVDTVAVQLVGEKTWRLRDNDQVPFPTFNWGNARHEEAEVAEYAHDINLPDLFQDPASAQIVTKEGHSVLVPHGQWHMTECAVDSISLHLHFVANHWIDVVLESLKSRLLSSPGLRKRAYCLAKNLPLEARTAAAREVLSAHQQSIIDAVRGIDVDDILAGTLNLSDDGCSLRRVVRRRGSGVYVLRRATPEIPTARVRFVAAQHGEDDVSEVEIGSDVLNAIMTLTGPESWTEAEVSSLIRRWPYLSADDGERVVRLLLDVGYLREAP